MKTLERLITNKEIEPGVKHIPSLNFYTKTLDPVVFNRKVLKHI